MRLNKKNKVVIIIVVVALIVVLSLSFFVIKRLKYKEYDIYKTKVENFGFDKLYNNGSANSYQSVTKIEAIKLIMATALDNTNIDNYITEGNDENERWTRYALKTGILSSKEQEELNHRATYIDVIRYLSNANYYILGKQYNTSETPKFSDYDKYTQAEKVNIADLVSNGIIENSDSSLSGNSYVAKGQLNKLVTIFYEKYVVAKDYGTIKTEDLPNNSSEYPFVLNEVNNKVYEQEFEKDESSDNVVNPQEYYFDMKDYYKSIQEKCDSYYNAILNVDYRTINKDEFKQKLQNSTITIIDDYSIEKYIEYVKQNEIIISGTSEVQIPVIYNDGFYCRARTKLKFNVENSKTMNNILFLDLNSGYNISYLNKDNEIYVDTLFSFASGSQVPYLKLSFIKDIILDISKDMLKIEKKESE